MIDRSRTHTAKTVGLCFLAAAFEGIDLQSMGIAGRSLMSDLHLTTAQFGTAASMSLAGLLIGATIGGRASDRWGRRFVLVGAMVALGMFSLLTTRAASYTPLLLVRFLVGLGLGGAFPTLIALVSDVAGGAKWTLPLSLMYAGIPMGTIIGALMVIHFGPAFEWRWIFYLGGAGPLALAVPLMLWLPESRPTATRGPLGSVKEALFGGARAIPSLLLWIAFFFTLLVIYLLTNWLNQLMIARGLSLLQATTVLLAFGIGSVGGSVGLGLVLDAGYRRFTAITAYAGVAAALAGLARFQDYTALVVSGACAGFFAVGAQLVNYAMAPDTYPPAIRGTGVGWTVAIGRTGSFFGPLVGGLLLSAGFDASTVLLLFLPCLAGAGLASTTLLWRSRTARPGPARRPIEG